MTRHPNSQTTKRERATVALTGLAAASLLVGACGTGGSSNAGQAVDPPKDDEKVTITIWSGFTERELDGFNSAIKLFTDKHPNITVKSEGNQDDDKITQAIRGGTAPDVTVSFSTDNVGQFCSSGAWQNLDPYVKRDKMDMNQFPAAVREYTQFKGTRCSLPLLADVYGLYYNTDLLKAAGYDNPPTTVDELTQMAKKLTVTNADGSLKSVGFMPLMGKYQNAAAHFAPAWGAEWQKKDGSSNLAGDKAWAEFLTWEKSLVDFYGVDKLTAFAAGMGDEWSADNAFESGQVAMMLDGEWRTAFIKNDVPDMAYGTAPFPVASDKKDLYGGGYVSGTIIGIPKTSKNAGAAWELVKFLTTDDDALVTLANALGNVPTTLSSLDKATDLKADPHFKTFLDIFGNKSLQTSPASPNGGQYQNLFATYLAKWETGQSTDLAAGLKQTDKEIDDAVKLGEMP